MEEDGTPDKSDWLKVKNSPEFQSEFVFANIPFMRDGDVKLNQSNAILKVSLSLLKCP